jgi:hypothetical protein
MEAFILSPTRLHGVVVNYFAQEQFYLVLYINIFWVIIYALWRRDSSVDIVTATG